MRRKNQTGHGSLPESGTLFFFLFFQQLLHHLLRIFQEPSGDLHMVCFFPGDRLQPPVIKLPDRRAGEGRQNRRMGGDDELGAPAGSAPAPQYPGWPGQPEYYMDICLPRDLFLFSQPEDNSFRSLLSAVPFQYQSKAPEESIPRRPFGRIQSCQAFFFFRVTARMTKGVATVSAMATGRQIQILGTKPASRKQTKEITATVPA